MKRTHCEMLALLALLAASSATAQTGYLLRNAEVKAKPYLDADTLVALPEKTAVEVIKQEGAWLLVKAKHQEGYVRLLQVRYNAAPVAATGGVPPLITVRRSGGSPTVTTGVRGFDEVSLQGAQPNPEELKKMQGYAASADAARQFAQLTQLSPRTLAYYGEDGKPVPGGK